MKKLLASKTAQLIGSIFSPKGEITGALGEGIKESAKRKTWKLLLIFGAVTLSVIAFIFNLITIDELKEVVNIFTQID